MPLPLLLVFGGAQSPRHRSPLSLSPLQVHPEVSGWESTPVGHARAKPQEGDINVSHAGRCSSCVGHKGCWGPRRSGKARLENFSFRRRLSSMASPPRREGDAGPCRRDTVHTDPAVPALALCRLLALEAGMLEQKPRVTARGKRGRGRPFPQLPCSPRGEGGACGPPSVPGPAPQGRALSRSSEEHGHDLQGDQRWAVPAETEGNRAVGQGPPRGLGVRVGEGGLTDQRGPCLQAP